MWNRKEKRRNGLPSTLGCCIGTRSIAEHGWRLRGKSRACRPSCGRTRNGQCCSSRDRLLCKYRSRWTRRSSVIARLTRGSRMRWWMRRQPARRGGGVRQVWASFLRERQGEAEEDWEVGSWKLGCQVENDVRGRCQRGEERRK